MELGSSVLSHSNLHQGFLCPALRQYETAEHSVAMNSSHCAGRVAEAIQSYLGWDVYLHKRD